jgi:hypothetical protein
MNPARRRSTRRVVVAGGTSLLVATAFSASADTSALQSDRRLLDLLVTLEQMQIARYQAILVDFDDEAFTTSGFATEARSALETILAAEDAHLAIVARAEEAPAPATLPPAPADLRNALREVAEIENLTVAAYALVIAELGKQGLIPDLLGIHSVEARHAAWLATLLGDNPVPHAVDPARTLEEILSGIAALEPAPAETTTPITAEAEPLLAAIARELGVKDHGVTLVTLTPEVWPDASLGCPQPDMVYAQVMTPGFVIEVEVNGERLEFHADEQGNVARCP